jgi:AraC-like DNA-binding protein
LEWHHEGLATYIVFEGKSNHGDADIESAQRWFAKTRLERTDDPVDEVSWRVGHEDSAFFRRLFKRTTGLAPATYRKRFRIPDFGKRSRATRNPV